MGGLQILPEVSEGVAAPNLKCCGARCCAYDPCKGICHSQRQQILRIQFSGGWLTPSLDGCWSGGHETGPSPVLAHLSVQTPCIPRRRVSCEGFHGQSKRLVAGSRAEAVNKGCHSGTSSRRDATRHRDGPRHVGALCVNEYFGSGAGSDWLGARSVRVARAVRCIARDCRPGILVAYDSTERAR